MKRLDLHTRSLRRRYALAFTILTILGLIAFKASAEEQQFSIDIPLSALRPRPLPMLYVESSSFEEFHEKLSEVYESFKTEKRAMDDRYWEMRSAALNQALAACSADPRFANIDQRYYLDQWSKAIRLRNTAMQKRIEHSRHLRGFVYSEYYRGYRSFEMRLQRVHRAFLDQHLYEFNSIKSFALKHLYSPSPQ